MWILWPGWVLNPFLATKKNHAVSITLNCIYHYQNMSYNSVLQSTKSTPCTNVPIPCPLCLLTLSSKVCTIWKYNSISHLICKHPELVPGTTDMYKLPPIPGKLMVNMFILRKEESWMGIAEEVTYEYQDNNKLPGSDAIEEIREEMEKQETAKQERAATLSVVEPSGKRTRSSQNT